MDQLIVGKKAICAWMGVSWDTVKRWKRYQGFPLVQRPHMRPMVYTGLVRAWVATIYGEDAAKKLNGRGI